jgi:8-oxo-dGTP pyrophosphatase MutT (NUDIX family)
MFEPIIKALQESRPEKISREGLTPAAVLVPLFVKDSQLYLLMNRRSEKVEKHKRQISFPGGACDPDDAGSVDTALREAREEIGLQPQDVEVLGILDDTWTITGFLVTPVVARIPHPYPFELSTDEVDEILEVPWNVFSQRLGYHAEHMKYDGQEHQVDFYEYENNTIWGATARIARRLIELVESCGNLPVKERR